MSTCSLSLLCPPELEAKVCDLLLIEPEVTLFSSNSAFTHGLHPTQLDPLEKVIGRGHSIHIQLVLDETQVQQILIRLKTNLPRAGIRYWICPVLSMGEIL